LADLPLSTRVCDVSQMQCLAKQEDLIRQLHVFFEDLRVGLASRVSYRATTLTQEGRACHLV
jgi:hypothetical protein